MMNARLNKALVAFLAIATVGACDDPPVDPASNEAARLATNPSFLVIEAGATRLVQAYLVNDLGNPVTGEVAFSACSGAISVAADPNQSDIEPGTNFNVTGNTLGESCINVSGAGFEETIGVRVIPAAIELTAPAVIGSGETVGTSVLFLNTGGTAATGFGLGQVTFTSLDEDVAVVDADGNITAQAPGTGQVVVSLNSGLGAPRADTVTFTVEPGNYAGSATPPSGPGGTMTTFDFGASDPDRDATSSAQVTFGFDTYPLWDLPGSDARTFVTRMPYGVAPATGLVAFTGLGPAEVAVSDTWELTAEVNQDSYDPNSLFEGNAPALITLPFRDVAFTDGDNQDDMYTFTLLAPAVVRLVLDWDDENGSPDLDLWVADAAFAVAPCTARTANHPETIPACSLTAGTWIIWVQNYAATYSGNTSPTNYMLDVRIP